MSRPCSIPTELAPSIITRWISGQSSGAIVDWIHATNHRRKAPTQTSKASVLRFIEHYSHTTRLGNTVPIVRRCRNEAPLMLDGLQEVEMGIRACIEDSAKLVAKPEESKAFYARLRSLGDLERNCFRRLKIAGIDGRTDIHLEEERDEAIVSLDDRFQEESEFELREDLGEAPNELPTFELPLRIESDPDGETRPIQTNGCRKFRADSFDDVNKDLSALKTIMERRAALCGTPRRRRAAPPLAPTAKRPSEAASAQLSTRPPEITVASGVPARATSPQTPVHAAPKIGRNEPCPCGSKLKWKKCHGGPNPPPTQLTPNRAA